MRGNAAPTSWRKWLAPTGFLGDQLQHSAHARLTGQEFAAQFVGIFAAGMSHFVEKALNRKSGVRMTDRTPPLHRNADFWRVQVHLQIRNAVEKVSCAFDRGRVHAVLDSVGFEGSARED